MIARLHLVSIRWRAEGTKRPARRPGGRTSPDAHAGLFLRLGSTAFGGPAAHIAVMQEEVAPGGNGRRPSDHYPSSQLLENRLGTERLMSGVIC